MLCAWLCEVTETERVQLALSRGVYQADALPRSNRGKGSQVVSYGLEP